MIYTTIGVLLVFIGLFQLSRAKIIQALLIMFVGLIAMILGVIQCQS